MAGRRRRSPVLGALVVTGFAVATSALVLLTASPAFAEEGLRYEAGSTYTVDPGAGVVRVVVEATLTNEQPNSSNGNVITQYYFPRFAVPMLSGAANVVATRDGRSQSVSFEPTDTDRFKIAFIDLSPDLYYGDAAHVVVTYDLPSEPPRSEATTRVNPAFATFWAWPVADPNLTSVRILIPKRFDVEYVGSDLRRSAAGDMISYESGAIADPATWGVIVSARDDGRLATRDADTADHDIEIRAWPDDPRWTEFVATQIEDGLPILEDLIDQPWPTDDELQITETVNPYLYGYAGWYSSSDNTIEVGDLLDAEVILHEISHIWFNDDLFIDRWVNEGFAQTYSNLAVDETGGDGRQPEAIKKNVNGAQALNSWSNPTFRDDEQSAAEEEFGYNASWYVIEAITDEIGVDKMRDVIDAAATRRIAYLGDPKPERAGGTVSWKRLLDLVENVGGSDEAAELWVDHVVVRSSRSDLQDRSRARKVYDQLAEAGGDWTVPFAIRQKMTLWQFSEARDSMATARHIVELRDEITETLNGTGIELPADFESSYEEKRDLEALETRAEASLVAAGQLAAATREAEDGHGIFGTIGLWGNDYEDELARAATQFEEGDHAQAGRGARAVMDTIGAAAGVGQQRVLVAVGSLVALLLLVWLIRFLVRRRRRRRVAARTAAELEASAREAAVDQLASGEIWPAATPPLIPDDTLLPGSGAHERGSDD